MMKVPILECFNDEGIINRQSYMDKCSKEFIDAIDLIKKHNIDTCLFLFIKDKNFPDEIKKKCKLFIFLHRQVMKIGPIYMIINLY